MRLIWIFLALAVILIIPFAIFGDMGLGGGESLDFLRSFGRWAWLVAILLLAADLLLPLPATAIIGALGYLYGPVAGALIGAAGSYLSASIAYWLCRKLGRNTAERLVGAEDLRKGERLFDDWGGWLVTLSRWLPLFPEVIACLAGMTRMPHIKFSVATLCGVLPLSGLFATIGHYGKDHGVAAILLSALLPPIFWLTLQFFFRRKLNNTRRGGDSGDSTERETA
jgi:uncharacterized membrane protein YdjX (TVP38/TMEM64 family)